MPATFETEALKAQAVTAHTYAERQVKREKENPTPELCGADFSNDTSKYQGYFTLNQVKQYYGDNFDLYYSKISDALKDVSQYIITYENEPIVSAFHSMSAGKTESAENAWGSPVDYLVSVDSSFDKEAENYRSTVTFTHEELKSKLSSVGSIEDAGTNCFSEITRTSAGSVKTIKVGGNKISGSELRKALELRSADFDVSFEEGKYTFTVRGYGHGIGMSQYGANCLAKQGKTYEEILLHYYTGCKIE
jgi:stage II sporulation protein D